MGDHQIQNFLLVHRVLTRKKSISLVPLNFDHSVNRVHDKSVMTNYQLPLPAPWTLETLPDYIDQLSNFINKYLDIGEFVSVDRFLREFPVDWGKEFTLETWMEIILGEYKGELADDFAEFMRLSRSLPLVDFPTPIVDTVTEQSSVGEGDVSAETKEVCTQSSNH